MSKVRESTARLEARVPVSNFDQMHRAAELWGMNMTAYILATAGAEARRIVEEADIMRLTRKDQIGFAKSLMNPPKLGKRWARAAKRHAELVEGR